MAWCLVKRKHRVKFTFTSHTDYQKIPSLMATTMEIPHDIPKVNKIREK